MKKLMLLLFYCLMVSCSQLIDEPKNLVPKDKMADLVAEFAMNDQLISVNSSAHLEDATRITLQQYKISARAFIDRKNP